MIKIRGRKIRIWMMIASAILLVYAFTVCLPMYFIIINSLKTPLDFYDYPWTLPEKIYWKNYSLAFQLSVEDVSLFHMYVNSVIFTVFSSLIACMGTTVTAYILARFDFRGKDFLVAVGIGAMLIPDLGSRSVIYKMYVDLHMIDTWFILIQYATPFGMMFLIIYSLFKTVSKTYAEAAKMDGASEMRIFVQIMIPMAKGVIGMALVMSAIGAWNDYYTPYMYLPSVKTLALGIQELSEMAYTISNFTELYAAMVLAVLPIVILFVCMRDTIINNAVAGGLKG